MYRFKKIGFLIAFLGLTILLGMMWQTASAEEIIIVLDDDVYFSFGPTSNEIDERLLNHHPQWQDFRQTVTTTAWTAGDVFKQSSFGGPEYGVNPAVLLVTVGMELNWQVPLDGDLYSLAVGVAEELEQFAVEYETREEVQKSYPQIGNQATYALYRFFNEDLERLVEWQETYQVIFSEDPSFSQVRSMLSSNYIEPMIQRPFDQHESSFYVLSSYFDHTYPQYKREPGANKDDITRFDGKTYPDESYATKSNISDCVTGINCYSGHPAIDYSIPSGVPVFAAASGKLILCIESWGALFVEHNNGMITSYLHMDPLEIPNGTACNDVDDDKPAVNRGQVIGYVSNKNNKNDPDYDVHLHFGVGHEAIFSEKQNVDPFGWWSPDADPWAQHTDGFESTWLWRGDEAGDSYLTVDNRESQAQLFRHPIASGDWNRVDSGYKGEAWYAILNKEAEATATSIHWAIWGANIATPGNYQIQAYWPSDEGGNPTSGAEYQIYRYLGEDLVVSQALADQSTQSDTWVVLDEIYLDQGPTVVMLSDVTHNPDEDGKRVYFDAIRWIYILPTPTPPTPTPPTPTPPPGTTITVQVDYGNDDAGVEPSQCVFLTTKQEVYIGKCDNGSLITSGFRFREVPIPPGAEIQEAYLEFTVDGRYDIPVEVRITGEDIGDAPVFSEFNKPSNRIHTLASTAWDIPPSEVWEVGNVHRTPEMKAIVQEIVDRPDWASGNDMAYIFRTTDSDPTHRRVVGYERPISENHNYPGTEHAARLVVTYTGGIPPSPTPPTPTPPTPTPPTPTPPTPTPEPGPICWITEIFGLFQSASMTEEKVQQITGTPVDDSLSVSEKLVQAVDLADFAQLLYRVRDEYLSQTEEGQHYIALFEEHTTEVASILFANPDLYQQGYDVLKSFEDHLQALVKGEGDTLTITSDQVSGLEAILDGVAAEASPELQNAIQTERANQPLEELIGLAMEQAWNHLNGVNLVWLPPISKADPYEAKAGSTIPVKFRIETRAEEFVQDDTVLLQIVTESGEVIGPFGLGEDPSQGITIQGKQYHLNLETKDLEPGLYTVEVYFNAMEAGELAVWSLELTKKK